MFEETFLIKIIYLKLMFKNYRLEFIRGVAAVMVFITHLVNNNPALSRIPFITLLSGWGTESVIIFFVLSGIVINISQTKKPRSTIQFLINRIIRIYPLYLISLVITYGLTHLILHQSISIHEATLNLLFLGTLKPFIVSTPVANPVVWSLTFEMFFYFIFSLGIGKNQKNYLMLWFIVALSSFPFYYSDFNGVLGHAIAMLSFSSIWLVGYYLYEYRYYVNVTKFRIALLFSSILPGISRMQLSANYYDVGKYFLFALVAVPVFIYCLNIDNKEPKTKKLTPTYLLGLAIALLMSLGVLFLSKSLNLSKAIYVACPFLVSATVFFKIAKSNRLMRATQKFSIFTGSISYSLYIVHFPLLLLLNHYLTNPIVYIICSIVFILPFSYLLEFQFQPLIYKFTGQKKKHTIEPVAICINSK